MSFHCLKCEEVWDYEDYTCPMCGSATVNPNSYFRPTLEYVFERDKKKQVVSYDVIRVATGESIFDEPNNYLNADEEAI